ncbi:MAG TPA: DUF167 domain-containing protein [Opitutales bacterium]|nr:DUF167 domain-containing protein [Opitutales bacterium]
MSAKNVSIVNIRVTPNAKNDEIAGPYGDGVKIKLRAPAVEGKANQALIVFLAKELGVSRNSIRIIGGDKARNKRVELQGPTREKIRQILKI